MKHIASFILVFAFFGITYAQPGIQSGLNEKEPAKRHLGAPLYPRAVYIRTTHGLDPYHETAEYVTVDDTSTVIGFFETRLHEKREITYEDKDTYLVIFLLKTWSSFPDSPPKEALTMLEREPNVQLRAFDANKYKPLIEFFDRRPERKARAEALRDGRTMILYTYRISEVDRSPGKLIGAWRESDRDLRKYWGSVLEFMPNGFYKHTFTEENLKAMAEQYAGTGPFKGMGSEVVKKILSSKNPETGTYAITKNVISLESSNPVDGERMKNGLSNIGNASLLLELVNKPKMVFVRLHDNRPEPPMKR
ncbi:MAG: hypothetical protein WCU00_08080 [Candidatus Latescibacterota bacterium]